MGWTNPDGAGRDLRRRRRPGRLRRHRDQGRPSRCSACRLFRIRAFTAGNVASFLASLSRGGLMFMLIIWLQGIWLPLHGYSFAQTPLWAGIYMIPLTVGFLAGRRRSAACWPTATAPAPSPPAGLVLAALTFILLEHAARRTSPTAASPRSIFLNSVGHGHVHRAQPDRHHEQPAGRTSAAPVPAWPAPSTPRRRCCPSASSSP